MLERRQRTATDWFLAALAGIACMMLAYLSYRELMVPIEYSDEYSILWMLGMLGIYVVVLIIAALTIRYIPEFLLLPLSVLMILLFGVVQIYIVYEMQLLPDIDLSDIMRQARTMVESGTHYFTDQHYFSFYTNNIPIAMVVYWIYRITDVLGCDNYELAGGLFNVAMNLVTCCCTWHIVSRYSTRRASTLLLFFLVTNPILYAYAGYYYTDTVSMAATVAAVDLFVTGKEAGNRTSCVVLLILSGVMMLAAFRLRATSLFIVLAAGVYGGMRGQWRRMARLGIPIAAGVLIASLCYSGLYAYHVDFDTTQTAAPWQHWLAMGASLENGGRWNANDVADTEAAPDRDSKVALNVEKWQHRVYENGLSGNLSLILDKEAVVWSYGTKAYFLYTQYVKDKHPIYEWIVGDRSNYLKHYMMAYNLVILMLMLAGIVISYVKRSRSSRQDILLIYWLGAVLFYVFWEALQRQSVSYLAFMSMMAVPVFEQICGNHKRIY